MATPGQFVWHELMSRDMKGAAAFYEAVVGWKALPWDQSSEAEPYTLFSRTGDPKDTVGGMMEMHEPNFPSALPTHFMGYISVADADAMAAKIVEHGGKIVHGPADIPNVGRFAIFDDPQGATVAIMQSASGEWEIEPPRLGNVAWCDLGTTDLEASYRFYHDVFGWEIRQDMDMGEDGIYRLVTVPDAPALKDRSFGGIYMKSDNMPGPKHPEWLYYFAVEDIDAATAAVKAHGGQVVGGPMDVPGGDRVAICLDPENTFFALSTITGGTD